MESIARIRTLAVVLTYLFCIAFAKPRIELSVPVSPVKEQGMISLKCQVFEQDTSNRILIVRHVAGETQIISQDGEISGEVDERFFIADRRMSDSTVHFLSVINANREDEGEYICNVFRLLPTGNMEMLFSASERIAISYFPEDIYPTCSYTGNLIEGNTLILNCSTEDSDQLVDINWKRTRSDGKLTADKIKRHNGYAFKEVPLTLGLHDRQTVFLCEITHPMFPDKVQSCHVGPLTVRADWRQNPVSNTPSPTVKSNKHDTIEPNTDDYFIDKNVRKAVHCNDVCSSLSSTRLSYWVIATIAACFIALFFLCIGIYLAVKLHRRMNSLPPVYHQDDIYSEIHSRRDNNRLYMTLAKIDNPINQAHQPNWELEGNYTGTPIALKP